MKIRSIILILCVSQFCITTATEPAKYAIKAGKILTMMPAEGSNTSLLDVTTPVDLVLINGKLVYQRNGVNLVAKEKQDSI